MDVLLCCDLLCFIFSELVDGSVSNNLLVDGSTVTLLPRAETGLIVSIEHNHNHLVVHSSTVGRREGRPPNPPSHPDHRCVVNISSLPVASRMWEISSSVQVYANSNLN